MNEDGEFVCDEHKPAARRGQWVVDASALAEQECKCEFCEKPVKWYVLEGECAN